MSLPNFIIAGASKSGTTSLYHYLAQHPDICMASDKEPKFFIDCERRVKDMDDYEALFSHCRGEKARGEATPAYLYDSAAPGKINEALPGVRIIIILRNPAEMAFALWRHVSRLGKRGEKLSFADALAAEHGRMSDPAFMARRDSWPGHFLYFERARYYPQVKRYIDTFGRDRVQVHLFEDFKADPSATCREIFRFLGVDDGFTPALGRHNVGVELRHRGLGKLVNSPPGWLSAAGGILPAGVTKRIKSSLNRINSKPPLRLDESMKKELLENLRPDVELLAGLIGRDLSVWYR